MVGPGVSVGIETACSKLTGPALLMQDEFNPLNLLYFNVIHGLIWIKLGIMMQLNRTF